VPVAKPVALLANGERPVGGDARRFASEADRLNATAVDAVYSGHWRDAEKAWEAALESDPDHIDSTFNRAVASWLQGATTDDLVLRRLERLLTRHRDESWKIHHLIGMIHLQRGDLDAAEFFFQESLGERPDAVEIGAALERVRALRHRAGSPALAAGPGPSITAIDLTPDGRIALSASDASEATLWDVDKGIPLRTLVGHAGAVSAVLVSADGRAALTGGDDGSVRVWSLTTGACERVYEMQCGRITSMSVNPEGTLLLWAARTGGELSGSIMQLWETAIAKRIRRFEGNTAPVRSVVLSIDGRSVVSGGDDRMVSVWDVKTGQLRASPGHDHFISAVCSSGELILSASWDRTLRLWDRLGRCLRVFTGHATSVLCASMSADAAWAASADLDGILRLWEVSTGRCLRTIRAHTSPVSAVAMSAGGDRVVSGSMDGTLSAWDTSPRLREPCRLRVSGS
jgi:hypothetical protein